MMEKAAEDGVAGQNLARTHRLIHSLGHAEHAIAIARIDNEIENFGVWKTLALCL